MKKLLCFILSVLLLISMVACSSGGDTNMYKVKAAVEKGEIALDGIEDAYTDSGTKKYDDHFPWDYEFLAYCSEVTDDYVEFKIFAHNKIEKICNDQLTMTVRWWAKGGEVQLYEKGETVTVESDSLSWVAEYELYEWDNSTASMVYSGKSTAAEYNVACNNGCMDEFYQNGRFDTLSRSSMIAKDPEGLEPGLWFTTPIDAINQALQGLNEIYTEKGYPIYVAS